MGASSRHLQPIRSLRSCKQRQGVLKMREAIVVYLDTEAGSTPSQPAFTCSKTAAETLEQGVKYVQS